ncbi:MAG: hypothetical protein ACM3OB_07300 [Acidobacteriota bacterium]
MQRIARRALLTTSLAALAVLLAGCGTRHSEHVVRVAIHDPSGRIGPPPWRVWAFPALAFYNVEEHDAWERTLLSRPDRPYATTVTTKDSLWLWESAPDLVRIGLFVPALKTGGWWSAEVQPRDGETWKGVARFCLWGNARPDGDAPQLPLEVQAKLGRRGWELTVTANVPPG